MPLARICVWFPMDYPSSHPQYLESDFIGRLTCTTHKFGTCIKSIEKGQSTSVIYVTFQGLALSVICCCDKMIMLKTSLYFFYRDDIILITHLIYRIFVFHPPHQSSTNHKLNPVSVGQLTVAQKAQAFVPSSL